jgi:hypothetical protein
MAYFGIVSLDYIYLTGRSHGKQRLGGDIALIEIGMEIGIGSVVGLACGIAANNSS